MSDSGRLEPSVQPGSVLDGKYELVRVIGEGGMGLVFEARHTQLRQRLAVKVLHGEYATSELLQTRFEREARAAARLRGRHVARVMDVGLANGTLPYMVMELLEGHDLDVELQQRGRLPSDEAVGLVLQACKAMAEAHAAGIVHRDLKPSNLFLAAEDGERVVKLLDFGISKIEEEASSLTTTQAVVGTVYYMSPEQLRSAKLADTRSDVWALGVILYELLTGGLPFRGDSATAVAISIATEEVPSLASAGVRTAEELEAAIRRAMAKRPDERFQSVAELAAAIAPWGPALLPSSTRHLPTASRSSLGLLAGAPSSHGKVSSSATVADGAPDLEATRPSLLDTVAAEDGALHAGAATFAEPPRIGPPRPMRRALALGMLASVAGAAALAVTLRAHRPRDASASSSATASSATTATALPPAPAQPSAQVPEAPAPGPTARPSAATTVASARVAAAKVPGRAPTISTSASATATATATPAPAAPAPSPPKREKAPLVAPF